MLKRQLLSSARLSPHSPHPLSLQLSAQMTAANKDAATVPSISNNTEPHKGQFAKVRGRTLSPRVIVYDRNEQTVKVLSKELVEGMKLPASLS